MGEIKIEIQAETMGYDGRALGTFDGRSVLLPYSIPGERLEARLYEKEDQPLVAEGITLLDASADRVRPRCPHFGPRQCGRCQWQHIDYPAQLLLKQDMLADMLETIGGLKDPEVRPVIASPEAWGYNSRMQFIVTKDGDLGLMAASSPSGDQTKLFPIQECHVLHPDLLMLKESLEMERLKDLEAVTMQRGSDGTMTLVVRMKGDEPPELLTDLPVSINMQMRDHTLVNLIGELYGRYTVKGRAFRVGAGNFFRANLSQMDNLLDAVLAGLHLQSGENVLDLFAGVGVFTAFIAPQAASVTLVESSTAAVDDADFNLGDVDNVDILEGRVEDVLDALEERFDAAVIDPPGGLSADTLSGLVALEIPRLVYVSGDARKLARDVKQLTAASYRLKYAQPLDLAPHTYSIDTVVVLER